MLDNFDQGKILAVKQLGGKSGLIKYMCAECNESPETYNDFVVFRLLKALACEMGRECKNDNLMFNFMEALEITMTGTYIDRTKQRSYEEFASSLIEALLSFVRQVRVYSIDRNMYLNGFTEEGIREFEEKYKPEESK